MKRIFYFSGHRLTVFHWSRKLFDGACSFEADQQGFDKFRQYLKSSASISTGMLLDIIEEDFRKDLIPHVMGKDRKAVIDRLIDRHYRSSRHYSYSEIQGQQKSGRKDDEVLLAAITNPELIRQWIGIIEECNVPLSGIWSLPLLSKSLLSVIGAKKGPVLLVTQQVNSNLRQTFFNNAKMVSSRQSVINQDAINISNIGSLAWPEVDKTLTFIRNQQQIEDTAIINVHILGSDAQTDSLGSAFVSDNANHYHVHRLKDVCQKLGINGLPDRFADGIFAWIAANKFGTNSHYGCRDEFNRFYYTLASNGLYAASVVVVIVTLLLAESNISEGISFKESTALLQERTNEFMRVYKEKYQEHEGLFSNANLMDTAVGLVSQIETNSRVSPMDFMVELSKSISSPQLGRVYIDKIEWTTRQISGDKRNADRRRAKNIVAYTKTDFTSANNVQHVAVVTGRIKAVPNNYRDSVNIINSIISALTNNERVEEVSAIDLPVEVRPEKKFASENKLFTSSQDSSDDKIYGLFSLKVVMKAPENV
ncbi:MAG: hypothetical protein WBO16_09855 [Gammaproteobacteria bacterium]